MKVVLTDDPEKFARHAGGFLRMRPVEHNVLATVLAALERREIEGVPLLAWVEERDDGEVSAAALRTPPWPLLASPMSAEAAEALMAALLRVDPELPGVNGVEPAASYLAEAWRRLTGGTVDVAMSQAIYSLAQVDALPRQPAGRWRSALGSDRDLLVEWMHAFSREVNAPEGNVEAGVDRRVRDGGLHVWEDERVVSMVGTHPAVAGVVRLAPVYTPPEARGRGYATALVAAVSRRALAADATRCMLYADLANPTSNAIYQAVGYKRSNDAQAYLFTPSRTTPGH